MNSHIIGRTATLLLVILTAILSACGLHKSDGGNCHATHSVEIAQITRISRWVELQSQTGERFDVDSDKFTPSVQKGHLYLLKVSRHTNGGCQPLAIQAVSELSKPGVSPNPSDFQQYQGAFILDAARNCAHQPTDSCANELKLSKNFDLQQQRSYLDIIKPKSLTTCPATTMATIWPEINADARQPRLIVCIQTMDGNAKAVEFLRVNVDTKQEHLLLNKFY